MNNTLATQGKQFQLLLMLLLAQVTLVLSLTLDIAIVREAVGFAYVAILPGFVIIKSLKLKLDTVEQVLFGVGISLVFFLSIGLILNLVGYVIGLSRPLEASPLLITASLIMDILAFDSWRSSGGSFATPEHLYKKLTTFGLLLFLPVFAVLGNLLASVPPYSNNLVLLMTLLAIAVLFGILALMRQLTSRSYVLILFAIALTLLFYSSFFSPFLVGNDIFGEFSVLNSTLRSSYWNSFAPSRLNAMLSVTVLPTIFSNILGVDGTWVFKIVYPLVFALVPVGLYQLFKLEFDERLAFLSVIFFMSNYAFFVEMPQLPRQMMGELFFVLLFLTVFKKDLPVSIKLALFSTFGFGIVVSHYAMAYIFLGLIVCYWVISRIRRREGLISLSMIALFATILFAWYIYASSGSTFGDLVATVNNLIQNFSRDFFNPQSRGGTTLAGLGAPVIPTYLHLTGQYLYNITELLVLVGFVASLIKYKRGFFSSSHRVFAFLSLLLLAACVIIPNFANTFNVERFYHVSLFFLAPFFFGGGIFVLSLISRGKLNAKYACSIVLFAILIPVFLFQTGFIYEATKEVSYALPLSYYRLSPATLAFNGVMDAGEVAGAKWLFQERNMSATVYSDITSTSVFDYTDVQNSAILELGQSIPSGSTIYLRQYNLNQGIFSTRYSVYNLTHIIPTHDTLNELYSCGSCEIYEVP